MITRFSGMFILLAMILPALSACNSNGASAVSAVQAEQAHKAAILQRSFEESKKVRAATVNGEVITLFALLREMNAIAPRYSATDRKADKTKQDMIRTDALNILVFQTLASQEARKRGLSVRPDVIDAEMKRIQAELGTDDAFRAYLAKNGLSEAELRASIEGDALFEMIATREVDMRISVTDGTLRGFYTKHRSEFVAGPDRRQMSFEEAHPALERRLRTEAEEKRMKEWQNELRKNARIEVVKETRKAG